MLPRIQFLGDHVEKAIPKIKIKAILIGVILAGLFAVAGCSETAEKPAPTNPTRSDHGPGHMPGGQEHGPGHTDGRGNR